MALTFEDVVKFMKEFEVDMLISSGELIFDENSNTYADISKCQNIEDVELYTTYALCRPIGKGLKEHAAEKLLHRFNNYFDTSLTRLDMRLMYGELCYPRKIDEFREFIKQGFPIEKLKTEEDYR